MAGADISELRQQDATIGKKCSRIAQEVVRQLEARGKPSIAAIKGFAPGGGCELALACTLRIASRTARLASRKFGIIPRAGGSRGPARLCGKAVAHELILTGDVISAEVVLRLGLVNKVVEPVKLIPASEALARKIAAKCSSCSEIGAGSYRPWCRHGAQTALVPGGVALRSLLSDGRQARRDARLHRKVKPEISGPMN